MFHRRSKRTAARLGHVSRAEIELALTRITEHPPSVGLNFPIDEVKKFGSIAVTTEDSNYHIARQTFIANYQYFPQIVVYCETFADVARALAFADDWKLRPVCRAGGHNTAGYAANNEMIIDVSRLSYVVVDPDRRVAVVGAGTNFDHFNATLDGFGLHVPGGGCGDVAVAGYMLNGGYGYTSLMYGMNSDNVIEALVMLADRSIVRASDECNPDLFWALRGAGGNNFGVLLQVTYKLYELRDVWGFGIRWNIGSDAKSAKRVGRALEVLHREFTGNAVPKGLGQQSAMGFVDTEPFLCLRGMYAGSPEAGKKVLAPLLETDGADFDVDRMGTYRELNDTLADAPPVAAHTRTQADSRYVARHLTSEEWSGVVALFQRSPNRGNFIGLEGYGGAIRDLGPTDTAFYHRDVLVDTYTWVFWQNEEQEAASLAFLEDFRQLLTPLANGHAYQNYPNRANRNYRWMFWGENFPDLLAIKSKYDPNKFFSFGHTISPILADEPGEVTRPTGDPGLDTSKPIERLVPGSHWRF